MNLSLGLLPGYRFMESFATFSQNNYRVAIHAMIFNDGRVTRHIKNHAILHLIYLQFI